VTTANYITLLRILLIPVFVGFALYYAHSVTDGNPDEVLYWAAVVTFAVASLSDAVDGYIARHYNQSSKLGVILDPLADKLLMLAAVCTLSFSAWPAKLPLYFVILSLSREIFTVVGAFVIKFCAGKVTIIPHWTGKVSTFSQIFAISAAMLRLDSIVPAAAALASVFVVTSGGIYIYEAYRQISAAAPQNHDL
jgi:cardiolipin synthase (CMP-forming)